MSIKTPAAPAQYQTALPALPGEDPYIVQTKSGDKLNQLQTMYKDRKFLIALLIVLVVLVCYIWYKFNSNTASSDENYQKIPLDGRYIDGQYSSLNNQRSNLMNNQTILVQDGESMEQKYYSRF